MSCWLKDPELFLYAKGTGPDDVHLRRCKKMVSSSSSSSSLIVPMKPDDFEYVKTVKNHQELIGDLFDWDETDYKRLVKYIYESLLLVNGQGLIIAEIYKVDDVNEVPIYIRSLDVLPLKPYIPELKELPIPLRMVRVDYLEALESNVKTLEGKIIKLTARVDYLEALGSNVKTLEDKVTKLTADQVTQMNARATVHQEVDRLRNIVKEVWMNDITNSQWVSFEAIIKGGAYPGLTIIKPPGTFRVDDPSTNVRAIYLCKVRISRQDSILNTAVCLEDLIPNKEKARFSPTRWRWSIEHQGKIYILATPDSS